MRTQREKILKAELHLKNCAKKIAMATIFVGLTLVQACGRETYESELTVSSVAHTPVKRQSVGNCWLFALASWMESLSLTRGLTLDVSESYWTYWDWFERLTDGRAAVLSAGGDWQRAIELSNRYGWVAEDVFFVPEEAMNDVDRQGCAEDFINKELAEDGRLFDRGDEARDPERVRTILNEAFTCGSSIPVDAVAIREQSSLSIQDTLLRQPTEDVDRSMDELMRSWKSTSNPYSRADLRSLKKLPSMEVLDRFAEIEKRIKRAVNDNMPVILSWHVDFNAVDRNGTFNTKTLARKGYSSEGGGHMVVLRDYTVTNVPDIGRLGEGEMGSELKEAALLGDLDYLVVKNSWGSDRADRPWLKTGDSRITWDYLQQRFSPPGIRLNRPMFFAAVLPPGY